MVIEIGHVGAILQYPVKSMGGERVEAAQLGWHGLDGDRRLAFRRIEVQVGSVMFCGSSCHRPSDGMAGATLVNTSKHD